MKPAAAVVVAIVALTIMARHCSSQQHYEDPSQSGCNDQAFQSADPWETAKFNLIKSLIYDTFSQPDSQQWTSYPPAASSGGSSTTTLLYGYASCAKTKLCSSPGNHCRTEAQDCSACLGEAYLYLNSFCSGKIGGHVMETYNSLQCYMQYDQTKFW